MQKKAEIQSSSTERYDAECRLGVAKLHKPGAPSTAESLVAVLAANGIARALVYHADAVGYDPVEGNQRLLEDIAGCPALEPCWVLLPHHTGEFPPPDIVLAQMLAKGVRAARVFPHDFRFAFQLWNLSELLSALAVHRIPLWVDFGHDGWSEESIDYEGLHEICGVFPALPVVLVRPNIGSDRRVPISTLRPRTTPCTGELSCSVMPSVPSACSSALGCRVVRQVRLSRRWRTV